MLNFILSSLTKNKENSSNTYFQSSVLGGKLLFSILLFSTFITLFLTSLQIYLDYSKGIDNIKKQVNQIEATQLQSLSQNLWSLNKEQIEIQLKGLLEIDTIKSLTIIPIDDRPITIKKNHPVAKEIKNILPLIHERRGETYQLGTLEVISDVGPVLKELESRVFIILLSQGAKTFIVSLFILFIFHILVSKHLIKITDHAKNMSLDNIGTPLKLERTPQDTKDELDQLVENINDMQDKIISELRKKKSLENQLIQSQKMEALGTLASGIAHDFNNILQGLYNALFLIEEEVIDNADALQKLYTAGNLVDRARELVKQILYYTRQEIGAFTQFSPVPAVQDVVEILRAAKSDHLSIDLFIDPPGGYIYGDKTQLKQVVMNLGNNALQSMEDLKTGNIKIFLRQRVVHNYRESENIKAGKYVDIQVQDTGPGIDHLVQKRIFEPFFTTKDVGKGTGLGLSVVQGIVEKHQGHISFKSEAGVGTTFSVLFPLIEKEENLSWSVPYTGKEQIHIISTDGEFRFKVGQNLSHSDHTFNLHSNAIGVLAEIKKYNLQSPSTPQMILVDQNSGDLPLEEFVRKVRQVYRAIPICYLQRTESTLPDNLRAFAFRYNRGKSENPFEQLDLQFLVAQFQKASFLISEGVHRSL